jgi:hypothetical protein
MLSTEIAPGHFRNVLSMAKNPYVPDMNSGDKVQPPKLKHVSPNDITKAPPPPRSRRTKALYAYTTSLFYLLALFVERLLISKL